MIVTTEDVMSWLKLSGKKVCGFTYGSERMLLDVQAREELYRLLCKRHMDLCGEMPMYGIDRMMMLYSDVRKGNYERLRDGKPIRSAETQPGMFGDPEPQGGVATVYAYIGWNARAERRCVKVGYTGDPLAEYLKKKVIAHNPELLASRCGGRQEEKIELDIFRNFLHDGDEWFRPVPPIFSRLRDERTGWATERGFELIAARAMNEWK